MGKQNIKRRGRLLILYSILVATETPRGVTYLMQKLHLAYSLLVELLEIVLEVGFVTFTPATKTQKRGSRGRGAYKGYYEITPKGKKIVELFEMLFDAFGFGQEIQEYISKFSDRNNVNVEIHPFWGTKEYPR